MTKVFLFDSNRCTGCGACVVGCSTAAWSRGTGDIVPESLRRVYTFNRERHPHIPLINLSMACNHCASPACLRGCPARAIHKDEETGAVITDPQRCMGCTYCTWTCPYDAPRYNDRAGVVEKCDFCRDRLKDNDQPACVCACPTGALRLGDSGETDRTADPGSGAPSPPARVPGFTTTRLQPSIRFKSPRRAGPPSATAPPPEDVVDRVFNACPEVPRPKITAASEWALLVFTSLAFILVALLTASVAVRLPLDPFVFAGAGVLGMGLSTVHLGQKSRAWRATLNVTRSWLSREIFFFGAFLGLAFIYLFLFPGNGVMGWAAVITGFLSLFCIDRIYQVAMRVGPLNFHSAHAFLNGLYLVALLVGPLWFFAATGAFKLALYLYRKLHPAHRGVVRRFGALPSIARLVLGFAVPAVLFAHGAHAAAVLCVIAGELIDRVEFYDELDVITPPKQIILDLKHIILQNKSTIK